MGSIQASDQEAPGSGNQDSRDLATCLACGSNDIMDLGKPRRRAVDRSFGVRECGRCGLRWAHPMPSPADLEAYYRSYYQRQRDGTIARLLRPAVKEALRRTGWFRVRQTLFLRLISRFCRPGVLVDYGCGDGQMLLIAKKSGWDVIGADYSTEFAHALRSQGIDFRAASNLRSSGISPSSVDCLIVKHVLEHLPDLEQFFSDCRIVLRPNAIIAIKTPSRSSLRARLGLSKWHYVDPPEHQWSFEPHCFRLMMESQGFEVVHLKNSLLVNELVSIARLRP